MLGESTNPKFLTQCSRNKGFAFFRVLPTLLNKTVVLNNSCTLLWTTQRLSMRLASLRVGGNSQLPMPSMYTIIHHFTAIIGEPLLRSCMNLNQT